MNNNSFFQQIRKNSVALISLFIAVSSLGYNTWRNELTEYNRNIRTAGFALIERMAELDQVVINLHYARNDMSDSELENSRKRGWVHVLAMKDLSYAMPEEVVKKSGTLFNEWTRHSDELQRKESHRTVDGAINELRESVLEAIQALE